MTRLGPGWLCQPKLPPGAIVFCRTWRSEIPLVLIRAFQNLVGVPGLMSVLTLVSMSVKRPTPIVDVVTLSGGVARAGTTINAALTSAPMAAMAARVRVRWTFIAAPLDRADGRPTRPWHGGAGTARRTRAGSAPPAGRPDSRSQGCERGRARQPPRPAPCSGSG